MSEEKRYTKCENCGAPVDDSSSSCPYCGSKYPEEVAYNTSVNNNDEISSPVEISDTVTTSDNKKIKGLNSVLAFILIICLPPVGIAYVVFCVLINYLKNYVKKD